MSDARSSLHTIGPPGPGGNIYRARIGPKRAEALRIGDGNQSTEQAVLAALRWLKQYQEPNGSWKMGQDQAATSLALLAFLGHGETPDSADFGVTVDRAIRYLIGGVDSNGVASATMYVQGLVGLALSEAYALTQSPIIRDPLEREIKAIIRAQQAPKTSPLNQGGWRYTHTSDDADLSVAGWQIMALKSARNAGIEIPDKVFSEAASYVWNMYGGPGFGYAGPQSTPNMTAVGILCQQFFGNGNDRRLRPALDYLDKIKMDWDKAEGSFILYGWYYMTQAMFQGGKSHWTGWNAQMRDALVKHQNEDGHWDTPGYKNQEKGFGPVYGTTLCCLMLEVYYRYLPMYQLTASAAGHGSTGMGASVAQK